MNKSIRWGIIGTGAIAKTFARGLSFSQTGQLVAVASRSQCTADAFATEFKTPRALGSYEALLDDPQVDAVYISTPHPLHAEWAIRACRAKKHVLVEKPIALNHADAMAIIEAAIENDVFLMEAFMYRCHPQTARLIELIRAKTIGEIRVFQATLSFERDFDPQQRLFNNALGGGGILDVGCYPVSMSRLLAGIAIGSDFAEPVEVKGVAHLGPTGVDQWANASLKFNNGVLAQLSCGVSVPQESIVRIFGSEGNLLLPNPWMTNRISADQGRIIIQRKGESTPREISVDAPFTSYTYEADLVGRSILAGEKQASAPAMSWGDTLGNMRVLDQWRESVGLVYDPEKAAGYRKTTVAGQTLQAQPKHNMKYGRIGGLEKPVSRLIMGVDNQRTLAHAAVMFDDYFERGGNTFDTAWIYAGGLQETLLGQWMKLRNVRDNVVAIAKGAHSPLCTPRDLTRQLFESLDRLQTDHADIYLMHRDNLEVPVGEFVDVLNEHQKAGRFKIFGGSNWTLKRVEEANDYAKRSGRSGFSLVSNNLSLARMVNEIWKGAVSASDPDSRAWFKKIQMPLLAWSSQARGFFLPGRAAPDKRDDEEMVRSWYSEDNFQRLARVNELAAKKNVLPINLALAYVLNQSFPTFALIGPRMLSETRTSLPALDIQLTEPELRWLNLET